MAEVKDPPGCDCRKHRSPLSCVNVMSSNPGVAGQRWVHPSCSPLARLRKDYRRISHLLLELFVGLSSWLSCQSPLALREGTPVPEGHGRLQEAGSLESTLDDRLCLDVEPILKDRGIHPAEVHSRRQIPLRQVRRLAG